MKAKVEGRALVVTTVDGQRALWAEIQIECTHCGVIQVSLPGHHLRVVRNLLTEWIAEHPELTGSESQLTELGRDHITGVIESAPMKES